ncbi:sensor histidine kinase [Gordonia aichiensis]|uniref:Sensor-like histidine kinase SenX3 n=1 Tax=Gordonia aichiensis NBRC 108223 TaxID=1220583 RepID=L7KDN3_9ACTN|nr:ATP-binding protein [Gordonia aichiensis]GAC46965.1 two-component histidine kinase SenX3 [Gordonia aichiensis NBRC 108223]
MTGVFVGGVTVAVVLVAAVAVGFALGRFWRRDAVVRSTQAQRHDDTHRGLDDSAVASEFAGDQPTYSLTLAERPRVVPESAELRDTDVHGTTEDGRMTTAGLLGLIVRNSDTAVAVVDQFRDVVLYNHRAVELALVRDRMLDDSVWEAAKEVLDTEAERRFVFEPPASALGFLSTGRARGKSVESVSCIARLVREGDERYAVVYGADDTEHLRVEATRRDFVANVSHELKTPVGAISLLAEALLESSDDSDSVQHFGNRVVAEATRMGNMVSELLALSRLQDGETADFSLVDVDALIEEAIESASVSAEAASISLRADAPAGLTVRGDRMLLLTALNNLIVNAISYSPPNTTVSVSRRVTRHDGRPMVAIAVTDRGIGIAPADQQRVFERFFRVDKARSRSTGGTGLGLAIVKHVAANHGGVISLWSKPGTGSTFTLCIPQDMTAEIDWDAADIEGDIEISELAADAVTRGEALPPAPKARPKETDT